MCELNTLNIQQKTHNWSSLLQKRREIISLCGSRAYYLHICLKVTKNNTNITMLMWCFRWMHHLYM